MILKISIFFLIPALMQAAQIQMKFDSPKNTASGAVSQSFSGAVVVAPPASPSPVPQPDNEYPAILFKKSDNELRIPFITSLPQRGDNAIVGKQMLAGIQNCLQTIKVFSKAPHKNQKIQFTHEGNNDNENSAGLSNVYRLLKKSPLLFGLLGTDTFLSLMKSIIEKKLLMLFPIDGSDLTRHKVLENVIYFRPSYAEELDTLLSYAVKMERRKKIALFYEASEWGEGAALTLESLLKKRDITLVAKASYSEGTISVQHAITKIANESPNAIFCLASPHATYNFIRNGINAGLYKCIFLGTSFLHPIQPLLKTSCGLDLVISSVVPDIEQNDLQIVKDYKQALKNFLSYRKHSPFYLEAFIGLVLASEIIKNIASDVTIDSIIKSCESLHNFDLRGLAIDFNGETRTLSKAVWVNPKVGQPWISKQVLDTL